MNYSELDYPGIEDKTTKNISYSHNLYFTDDLAGKSLKIDDNLRVLDSKTEINAVNFLSEFVLVSRNERSLRGTFFCFTRDLKKKKRHFDAHDRVRMFLTATRLFTGKKADSHFDVSVKNSQTRDYYRPFDLRTDKHDFDEYRNFSAIKTRKDFNVIRKIHSRLGSANFEKTLHYSKLYNAVKFFNHAYDEHWTLLRTTLFFTALESLFSDSSKSEVTEKIAMRTAYLLYPKDSLKRKETYIFIKRGYEIRSLFVHGSNTEVGVNRIMKKFENERGSDYYGFHHHFVEELHQLVCDCLRETILNDKYFEFFSAEKHKDKQEQAFYTDLVL